MTGNTDAAIRTLSGSRMRFLARLEASEDQYARLRSELAGSREIVENAPLVASTLEKIQEAEHLRTVGAYEQLLTLWLRDVMGGQHEVVLKMGIERGLPSLHPYIRKESGHLEDAMHGTGGSIKNLLATGFRFIALMQSGKRPFLVLDEPDHWLRAKYIPRFMECIAQLSAELGIQVMLISHHSEELFEHALPHRLILAKNGEEESLSAQWSTTGEIPEWSPEQPGIRSLEIIGFQSHAHTVIPLSPHVTLIQGDNDIGKSAITRALRSVFYNESNDIYINHAQQSARVNVDLGPEGVLCWERHRKGKIRERYTLLDRDSGKPMRQSDGTKAPAWIQPIGIGNEDGFEIQLPHQEQTLFFLDPPASTRARMVAIGEEGGHVQRMIAIDRKDISEAKLRIKAGEKDLERLFRERHILEPLRINQPAWEGTETLSRKLDEKPAQIQQMKATLEGLNDKSGTVQILSRITGSPAPVAPRDPPDRHASELLRQWKQAHLTASQAMLSPAQIPTLPAFPERSASALLLQWKGAKNRIGLKLPETRAISIQPPVIEFGAANGLLRKWKSTFRLTRIQPGAFQPPEIIPPDALTDGMEILTAWKNVTLDLTEIHGDLDTAKQDMEQCAREIERTFPQCPTCQQPLPHAH